MGVCGCVRFEPAPCANGSIVERETMTLFTVLLAMVFIVTVTTITLATLSRNSSRVVLSLLIGEGSALLLWLTFG